jgi:hypothetical protein
VDAGKERKQEAGRSFSYRYIINRKPVETSKGVLDY